MKIRRFVARDMRTALTQIKEELGADAVIMSNKKIPEGVELMAAVDQNQQQNSAAVNNSTATPAQGNSAHEMAEDVVSHFRYEKRCPARLQIKHKNSL